MKRQHRSFPRCQLVLWIRELVSWWRKVGPDFPPEYILWWQGRKEVIQKGGRCAAQAMELMGMATPWTQTEWEPVTCTFRILQCRTSMELSRRLSAWKTLTRAWKCRRGGSKSQWGASWSPSPWELCSALSHTSWTWRWESSHLSTSQQACSGFSSSECGPLYPPRWVSLPSLSHAKRTPSSRRVWCHATAWLSAVCNIFHGKEDYVTVTSMYVLYGANYGVHVVVKSIIVWKDLKLVNILMWWYIFIAGGFGSYLLGMDQMFHDRVNTRTPGDVPGNENVKNPGLGWMMGFIFTVSFIGIFSIVLLRKVLLLLHQSTIWL